MISIKIKDPLFTYYARSVNILDFNPEKLSIEKVHAINDELERIYHVKYNNNPFYLVIDNLKDGVNFIFLVIILEIMVLLDLILMMRGH